MQIKEIKPINFLFFRAETTVNQLHQFLPIGQQLIQEAVRLNLSVTGPVHWHYVNFTGDLSQPFTLEVSLPVGEVIHNYDGNFHFKRSDSFKALSIIHEGSWYKIPESYGKLMEYIGKNNLTPMGVNREIYINVDLKHEQANTTEIQMGIK